MIYSFASGMSKPVPFVDIAPATVGGHIWVTQTDLVVTAFASMPKNATTNGTLYLCDLTTLPATPLRDDSGTALQGDLPSASAGGKWLTFITYSNYKPPKVNSSGAYTSGGSVTETLRVFGPSSVVQTVSSAKRMLDVEGSPFGKATISPDGGKIFTQQTGSDIGFGAKIYNTDGSKPKAFGPFVYPGGGAWDRSGSGNLIFAGSMDKNAATSGLLLYGQGVTQIFKTKKYYISDVTWSPDGQWIAFAAVPMTIDAKAPDVWVISIDGSSLTLLAKHAASPSWGMVAQP
jgi:Tol biopolymer transport system component